MSCAYVITLNILLLYPPATQKYSLNHPPVYCISHPLRIFIKWCENIYAMYHNTKLVIHGCNHALKIVGVHSFERVRHIGVGVVQKDELVYVLRHYWVSCKRKIHFLCAKRWDRGEKLRGIVVRSRLFGILRNCDNGNFLENVNAIWRFLAILRLVRLE